MIEFDQAGADGHAVEPGLGGADFLHGDGGHAIQSIGIEGDMQFDIMMPFIVAS